MVQQESANRTIDQINFSETHETRLYTQSHDAFNRILDASETFKSRTILPGDGLNEAEGIVQYAVGTRNLQPYATGSETQTVSFDPYTMTRTHATQTTQIVSDTHTGRALSGTGRTESASERVDERGNVLGTFQGTGVIEESFIGLSQANGLGLVSRQTRNQSHDILFHLITETDDQFTQQVNGVGKVVGAHSVTQSETEDEAGLGVRHTVALTETDYRIAGNTPLATAVKTVEVSDNKFDSSYRIVVREDLTRYDPYGRILPILDNKPQLSGFQSTTLQDITIAPIPANPETVEAIFKQHFGG